MNPEDVFGPAQVPWRDEPSEEVLYAMGVDDAKIQSDSETRQIGDVLGHVCPECGADMVLRRGKFGLFYGCTNWPNCDCTHGAHQKTGMPFGIPANKMTRQKRMEAHAIFDKLWKNGHMERGAAYKWLARVMSMDEVHIGNLDIKQCEFVCIVSHARLRVLEKTKRERDRANKERVTGGRGGSSRQERKMKKRNQAKQAKAAKKKTKDAGRRQYRSLGDEE